MRSGSILALDPGMTTGWCRSDGTSGVFDSRTFPDWGEALAVFGRWLSNQFADIPTSLLLIERPFFVRMHKQADFTIGVIWKAHSTASLYDVPRREERADDVRKGVIDRCRKKKGESDAEFDRVILKAVQDRGFYPSSEHAADAAALLCFYKQMKVQVAA